MNEAGSTANQQSTRSSLYLLQSRYSVSVAASIATALLSASINSLTDPTAGNTFPASIMAANGTFGALNPVAPNCAPSASDPNFQSTVCLTGLRVLTHPSQQPRIVISVKAKAWG